VRDFPIAQSSSSRRDSFSASIKAIKDALPDALPNDTFRSRGRMKRASFAKSEAGSVGVRTNACVLQIRARSAFRFQKLLQRIYIGTAECTSRPSESSGRAWSSGEGSKTASSRKGNRRKMHRAKAEKGEKVREEPRKRRHSKFPSKARKKGQRAREGSRVNGIAGAFVRSFVKERL